MICQISTMGGEVVRTGEQQTEYLYKYSVGKLHKIYL